MRRTRRSGQRTTAGPTRAVARKLSGSEMTIPMTVPSHAICTDSTVASNAAGSVERSGGRNISPR
jgi:hypothetical protein